MLAVLVRAQEIAANERLSAFLRDALAPWHESPFAQLSYEHPLRARDAGDWRAHDRLARTAQKMSCTAPPFALHAAPVTTDALRAPEGDHGRDLVGLAEAAERALAVSPTGASSSTGARRRPAPDAARD